MSASSRGRSGQAPRSVVAARRSSGLPPADALQRQAFRALGIHHFLQIARRLVALQWRVKFRGQQLCEHRVKQLVAASERHRTRTDNRDNLALANLSEKSIPKIIV